jgi:hypothetical protein
MAIKIVAALIGFIAGVLSYPYYDRYVLALIAFIGAIATGVVVYALAEAALVRLFSEVRR